MLFLLLTTVLAAAPDREVPADLVAVGTVVSPRAEGSVAILHAGGRSRVVAVGDSAFGGRVVAITFRSVLLDFDGQVRELRLSTTAAAALPPQAPMPPAAGIHADDPDARSMDRREVERRLNQEASRILAETTIVPVTDGGRQVGFTLSRIPEGTLLTEAGLQPGDVLTQVNDIPVDSLATLIGLWPRLQSESMVRAIVLRNGKPVSLTVSFR